MAVRWMRDILFGSKVLGYKGLTLVFSLYISFALQNRLILSPKQFQPRHSMAKSADQVVHWVSTAETRQAEVTRRTMADPVPVRSSDRLSLQRAQATLACVAKHSKWPQTSLASPILERLIEMDKGKQ